MAQSVVVLSSQLITTLSALAYLRWRGIRGTRLEVVSLYRDDLSHSAKAFQPLLLDLAAQDGHDCRFIAGDSAFTEPEPRACSLLLLPRLDDRKASGCCTPIRRQRWWSWGNRLGLRRGCIHGVGVGNANGCCGDCTAPMAKLWSEGIP